MSKAPTAKQIAARERFAKMARSGAFKRTRKRSKLAAKNPAPKKTARKITRKVNPTGEYFVNLPSGGKYPHDEWVTGKSRTGGWQTSPDFADAVSMSKREADEVKAHCRRVRIGCEVVPVERVDMNPLQLGGNPAPRARKVTHVELDSTGDHFGADQTTIQLWHLRAGETKRAYRSFRIPPAVVKNADFQAWARGMNYVLSMNYRQMVEKLRKFA